MTFEALLVKYLYQHKQVSLQGFGTVTLGGAIPDADIVQKNRFIPVDGLSFIHNFKANTDEAFTAFYSEQRGKIRPLAISDIESHLQLARQLMNIGKAYELPGLGIFEKQSDGSVILHPGYYAIPVDDHQPYPSKLKERAEVVEKKRVDPAQVIKTRLSEAAVEEDTDSAGGIKKWIWGIGLVLLVAAGAWYIYTQFFGPKASSEQINVQADSAALQISSTDSAAALTPVPSLPTTLDSNSVYQWKAYFRTIDDKAQALAKLKMYKTTKSVVYMDTKDSLRFNFYVVFDSRLTDTARKADSVSKFFAREVVLEKLGQ